MVRDFGAAFVVHLGDFDYDGACVRRPPRDLEGTRAWSC